MHKLLQLLLLTLRHRGNPIRTKSKSQSWKERRLAKKVKELEAKAASSDTDSRKDGKGGKPRGVSPAGCFGDAPVCPTCHDLHHGKCLKDRVKEQREQLAAAEAKLKKQQDYHHRKKEGAAVQQARALPEVENFDSDSNEEDFEYPSVSDWNPDRPPANVTITSQRACFALHHAASLTDKACVDSGANVNVAPSPKFVTAYTGGHTSVKGYQGAASRCPNVQIGIPTVTKDGEPVLLDMPGPSILNEDANGLLLAHSSMQRAGFKIKLRPGTQHNASDGGYIRLPDGRVVLLTFEDDLYYLPVHTPVGQHCVSANPAITVRACARQQLSPNPFHLLQDDDSDPTPPSRICQWTQQDLQTSHEAWCHPGHSKQDEIICAHPTHFPADPAFRAAALKL